MVAVVFSGQCRKSRVKKDSTWVAYLKAVPEKIAFKDNRAEVTFREAHGGLAANDKRPLRWFALAGTDRIFHQADAEIRGRKVIVRSAHVPQPAAVCYAWCGTVNGVNLYNRAGLPARPFRSDR